MSLILFILGILVSAAGVVAIGFGIPINEFNLGNTLIVAGTIAFAGGLILIGLAAAVDQLTQIASALRPRAGARQALQPQAPQAVEPALAGGARPGPVSDQVPVPAKAPLPGAPRGPAFAKARAEDRGSEPASADPAPEAPFSAIERLRSSLERSDRKAGATTKVHDVDDAQVAEAAEDVPYAPIVPSMRAVPTGPSPGTPGRANGAAPPRLAAAVEAPKKPPLDFLFRSKSRQAQSEAFDAVWPKRGGQRRPDEQADAGEPARSAPSDAMAARTYVDAPPASVADEPRPAAILKSGVVDGMAYTLYADGSIEAQLPQGTVRFGSIAELRSHIEDNS
jgi:hypothetical protein